MHPLPQDTPVSRALVRDLTPQQLEDLVDGMRERRMRAQKAYELAQEAKKKLKLQKDKARYDKLLEMLGKKLEATDKALTSMSKYVNELKVLEIAGE